MNNNTGNTGCIRGALSFGARPCKELRKRLLVEGIQAMPKSWQRKWMFQRIIATPPWADFKKIKEVYIRAAELTLKEKRAWTVGHIVPLNNPRVCGLHVHWNIQPELASKNFSKGNWWVEWQGEMFTEPEQLRLL